MARTMTTTATLMTACTASTALLNASRTLQAPYYPGYVWLTLALRGIIGARQNNSIGIAGVAGGRNDRLGVSMMHLKVFPGRQGFEEALVYAADMGAAIACNAWSRASLGALRSLKPIFERKTCQVLLLAQWPRRKLSRGASAFLSVVI
eukprot:6197410-Pleurochrysis_carterae.AAC.2